MNHSRGVPHRNSRGPTGSRLWQWRPLQRAGNTEETRALPSAYRDVAEDGDSFRPPQLVSGYLLRPTPGRHYERRQVVPVALPVLHARTAVGTSCIRADRLRLLLFSLRVLEGRFDLADSRGFCLVPAGCR
jgi:hypothetical protein